MCFSDNPPNANYPVITVDPGDFACQGSVLRLTSKPVRDLDINVDALVAAMIQALYSVPHGRGLSAIQLGIPAQVFVVNIERIPGKEIVMIDPEESWSHGRWVKRSEGCMSLPDYKGTLKRRNEIRVRGKDIRGKELVIESRGYEANVIQHELDHLNGVLFWDHMPEGIFPEPINASGAI